MKQKDMVYLVIAVLIFVLAGYLGFKQLKPKSGQSKEVKVEVIRPITAGLDDQALTQLRDPAKAIDFNPPIDLNGLGNPTPFNPI